MGTKMRMETELGMRMGRKRVKEMATE